jgi:hypothetical protein
MTRKRIAFAAKPPSAERWIAERTEPSGTRRRAEMYSARLTIDVTPALRGRIKFAAFQRGTTAATLLRELLETSFPETEPSP